MSAAMLGINIDGAFAEYMVCDSRPSCKLPDAVSFEVAAPMACAGEHGCTGDSAGGVAGTVPSLRSFSATSLRMRGGGGGWWGGHVTGMMLM